jgi:hypothetical protein
MLIPSKQLKFVDVKPGSTIRVSDVTNSYTPFEALVIEMKKEYGPHRIPALVVTIANSHEPTLLMGNGQTRIEMIEDTGILVADHDSINVVHLRTRIKEVKGMQFTGGLESAVNIIAWAAGRSYISYVASTALDTEHLDMGTLEGNVRVSIGHYVLSDEDGKFTALAGDLVDVNFETID